MKIQRFLIISKQMHIDIRMHIYEAHRRTQTCGTNIRTYARFGLFLVNAVWIRVQLFHVDPECFRLI